uniref:Envelope protein n=1 Tax=Neovison vison TaxID=452646 RepID=A0A8C7AXZ1_NEOVI
MLFPYHPHRPASPRRAIAPSPTHSYFLFSLPCPHPAPGQVPKTPQACSCFASRHWVPSYRPVNRRTPSIPGGCNRRILSQTGEVVWETSQQHTPYTWWPSLTPDFYKTQHDFYVCPKDGRSRAQAYKCGGYQEYFCASWGCETTGDAYWNPSSSWDLITVKRGFKKTWQRQGRNKAFSSACPAGDTGGPMAAGLSLPLNISFTERGKRFLDWSSGRTWGLRWSLSSTDRGVIFKIKLKIQNPRTRPVGPNLVLPDLRAPSSPQSKVPRPAASSTKIPRPTVKGTLVPATPTAVQTRESPKIPGTGDRLINLVRGVYQALNFSSPERASNCLLCLNPSPPYYEGIALSANYTNSTDPSPLCLAQDHSLTLSQVSGAGLCIGTPPHHVQKTLCNSTHKIWASPYYLIPPNGTYWACNTGLTPCVSAAALNQTTDYCVLVQLWPRITYHADELVLSYHGWSDLSRVKREPTTLITLAMLLGVGGIAAGVDQYLLLHHAMNEDLRALEQSVRALKESLSSLSEVVLQNRRGLDLLFLKEGGLCAALKEECCFFADQTGLVTETLDKLKERLDKPKRDFESQQSWYEGIWNRSPWFTSLISSLMGPLILLVLILTFGPCIINRLTQFVKDRLSLVQAMVLTQYHAIEQRDNSSP